MFCQRRATYTGAWPQHNSWQKSALCLGFNKENSA